MAKRLDFLAQPAVEDEEAALKAEEKELWDLASQRTQKLLEWVVTERLTGRVTTDTSGCWAALLAPAGPQKRQAVRSDKIKEEKTAEEMAQPPVKRVGREEAPPDAAAAASQIGDEEDGRGAASASASFTDGSYRIVSAPTSDGDA